VGPLAFGLMLIMAFAIDRDDGKVLSVYHRYHSLHAGDARR